MKTILSVLVFMSLLSSCRDSPRESQLEAKVVPGKSAPVANKQPVTEQMPMAPMQGPSKREVLRQLRRYRNGPLEITLGRNAPQFFIRFSDGYFELLPLVLDVAKANQAGEKRYAEGNYMPEMDWQYLAPGEPIIRESSLQLFISKLESWPGWVDVQKE
jgi:hypothetical protein